MEEFNLQEIFAAQTGDLMAREKFIQKHKPFIAKVSSAICHKYLSWENDDELSVALLAFNEAIDNFNSQKGASFSGFAQTVIKRRLIDFFRQESKQQANLSPMDASNPELNRHDLGAAQEQYREDRQRADFAEIVELYTQALLEYDLALEDLVKVSPKHRDSKQTLIRAARELSKRPILLEYLKGHKMLPLKELENITGIKRKVLEKGRKYIIATTLILSEPEFYPLKTFARI